MVVAVVADNASAAQAASEGALLHCPNGHALGCLAHMLQLPVKQLLFDTPEFKGILDAFRTLAKYCRREQPQQALLKLQAAHLKVAQDEAAETLSRAVSEKDKKEAEDALVDVKARKPVVFLLDMEVRWNSTLSMLRRGVRLREFLPQLRHKFPDLPVVTSTQWDTIQEICVLLTPFYELTQAFSGDSYPTISLLLPGVRGCLAYIRGKNLQTPLGQKFARELYNATANRFSGANNVAVLAMYLDIRFHKSRGNEEENKNITAALISQCRAVKDRVGAVLPPTPAPSSATRRPTSLSFMEPQAPIITQPIVDEVTKYMNEKQVSFSTLPNPMTWWEEKKQHYPHLYELAKKFLVIPATSVTVERMFSISGVMDAPLRGRTAPELLDALVFLKSNFDWVIEVAPCLSDRVRAKYREGRLKKSRQCL
jgi:hypothetical protein